MKIEEIIEIESKNIESINLYKEGIFWKAYQKSAYLVVTHFRSSFSVKIKYIKCVKENVLSIGFPSSSLLSIFKDFSIEKLNEKRLCVHFGKIDEIAYKEWVDVQIKKNALIENKAGSVCNIENVKPADSNKNYVVLQKLKNFNVLSSTPIDCMMLVSELQKMLP